MRPLPTTIATIGAAAAVSGAVLLAGAGGFARAASTATPSKTVTVTTLKIQNGTLGINAQILNSRVNSRRTYLGNSFGVGLGRDTEGAVYPVKTGNGGRTWHTDGPALFLPTMLFGDEVLSPDRIDELDVTTVTASTKSLQYAFGGGGSVVDVTRGGGPTWRSALFDGVVMAVVPGSTGDELIAFVDTGSDRNGTTYQYVTRNGGVSWSYTTTVGG
jgi:hypothetical protein